MMPHIRTELWIVDLLCSIICDTAGQARHGWAWLGLVRHGAARYLGAGNRPWEFMEVKNHVNCPNFRRSRWLRKRKF